MPEAEKTMKPAVETMQAVAALLREASDQHGWRAKSFAGALGALAGSDALTAGDLGALAEALEEHVAGLADAVNEAHALLSGRADA